MRSRSTSLALQRILAELRAIPVMPAGALDAGLIADLRTLREAILADRGGRLVDVDGFIEQMCRTR